MSARDWRIWPDGSLTIGENGSDAAASVDELQVWRVDLDAHPGATELLDRGERLRAERFVVKRPARQFRAARSALRRILSHHLERDPASLRFASGPHGKPALADGDASFNLSHSASWAVITIGSPAWGDELGIDVEEVNPARRLDRLARRFFAAEEYELYQQAQPDERVVLFYRLWTLKEAYVKALGTGLTYSSRRFALEVPSGAPARQLPRLLRCERQETEAAPRRWRFFEFSPDPPRTPLDDRDASAPAMQAALCWPARDRETRLVFRDYGELQP